MLISDLKETLNKIELAHGNLEIAIQIEAEDDIVEFEPVIFEDEDQSIIVLMPTDKSFLTTQQGGYASILKAFKEDK